MATELPRALIDIAYEEHAQAYLRSLPPEHFMEATAQGTQRKITLESLDLLHADRPDVQVFNELLVQYPRPRRRKPGQVVPDNMVVVCDQPIRASSSFNLPLQIVRPFWTLEYVSKHNKRKDYDESFRKYERQLKVPYYLIFYPDDQELTLYRHNGKKYVTVKANEHGRHAIPELDLELALHDGWVRFWYKGRLLPLPADMQRELTEVTERAFVEKQRADDLQKQLAAEQKARQDLQEELARLRARLGNQ